MSKVIYSPVTPQGDTCGAAESEHIFNKTGGASLLRRALGLCAAFLALFAVSFTVAAICGRESDIDTVPSEETPAIDAADDAVLASISDAQAMHEAEIDALIVKTEAVVQRLKDLDDSESMIREQVGLEPGADTHADIPVSAPGGVGGPAELHRSAGDMTLNEKIDYVTYLVRYADVYASVVESRLTDLSVSIDEYYEYLPHMWPVTERDCCITSGFGWRIDPISGEAYEFHSGIDIADVCGTDIYASASGTVISASYSDGYGFNILIDHGNGHSTRYSHCSELLVSDGDTVCQGQLIAHMGSTGRSTGSHCDFRIYCDGCAIDPMTMLDYSDITIR